MLSRIKDLFTPDLKLEEHLDDEHLRIATCVVMVAVARADEDFSDAERDAIVEALQRRYDLPPDEAHELVEAAEHAQKGSRDLFQFTNCINQSCSMAEKIEIIEEVWRIIYADHSLDRYEDHIVHRLQKLFNMTHKQLIDAKLHVLESIRKDSE